MMALLQPKAAALYTSYKLQELDYSWHVKTGQPSLFTEMEEVYRTLLASRTGNSDEMPRGEVPLICVIIGKEQNEQRIGLLVGAMPTERKDPRIIYDTLYLEFDVQDKKAALSSIATLLYAYDDNDGLTKYQEYERSFLKYAEEQLYTEPGKQKKSDAVPQITLTWDDAIPTFAQGESWAKPEVAVHSSLESRRKCARYLKKLADAETPPESLIMFSTGRLSREQLQQYADKHEYRNNDAGTRLIFLTLSESVQGEISLLTKEEQKQQSPSPLIGGLVKSFTRAQSVASQVVQTIQHISSSGNLPAAGQPVPTNQQTEPKDPEFQPQSQGKDKDSNTPKAEEADNTKIQPNSAEKQTNLARTAATSGAIILLVLGSLFFATRDHTPPQLARLAFQASDKPALTLPFPGAVGTSATTVLPRVGAHGAFALTFNEPIQPKAAPHLTINAGQGNATIPPQPCQPAEPQIWRCPVALPTANPNVTATITITISDAKDRANNTLQPINMTSLIESAELQAHVAAINIKDGVGNFIVQAMGRYGVATVHVNTIKAVLLPDSSNQWGVEVPLEPVFQSKQPLTITITDIYGNTVTSQLF